MQVLAEVADATWTRWVETQSPLWVIYLMVITGLAAIGRMLLKWLPTVFEKHCAMLDTATKSMADSATVVSGISAGVNVSHDQIRSGQSAIADAAVPACRAILLITPRELVPEVKSHLDEVTKILAKPNAKG
jgi:hypothetical protein